ncbi:hypothetical protein BJ165DRAFT_1531754 [Panaeolus papilionaceus]|nr:hypothetical protein BJ165DRAFT_1531754 [Panaeolus papilionaceus]
MAPVLFQRDEMLATLNSFGAELPHNCTIPVEELDKRVIKALQFSQRFDELFHYESKKKLEPHNFPKWADDDKKVAKAMQRLSVEEAVMGSIGNILEYSRYYFVVLVARRLVSFVLAPTLEPREARSAPVSWELKLGATSPITEIFTELKHTMMGLGYAFDVDSRSRVYFVGAGKDWLIEFQTVSVHRINDDTPLILFYYNHQILPDHNALELITPPSRYSPTVVISELERKVLLALWDHNSQRLTVDHRKKAARKPGNFKASFVLPLGSIGMRELGSLSKNTGCVVCGQPHARARCDKCLSVVYCSGKCQEIDWQMGHKNRCVGLKDATWHDIVLHDRPDGVSTGYTTIINRKDQIQGAGFTAHTVSNASGPSYNKIILVKMQTPGIPGFTVPGHIMMYDRQRKFRKFWMPDGPSDASFQLAVQKITGKGGKIYCWIKHVDETKYEVCLDRFPVETLVW